MKYYDDMNDTPLYDLFRQAIIKTENQFMAFSDSSWKYFPYNGISTGVYIIFYQGGPIYHGTHVTGPVSQSGAESEYNSACTTGMNLAHFSMLFHEFLNNYPYIGSYIFILDIKSDVCMAKNGNDTNHTRNIARRVIFIRNGKNWKMHKIYWFEVGLQLADIAAKNVGENDLNPGMKYIMVKIDNWYRTLVQ